MTKAQQISLTLGSSVHSDHSDWHTSFLFPSSSFPAPAKMIEVQNIIQVIGEGWNNNMFQLLYNPQSLDLDDLLKGGCGDIQR